MYVVVVRRGDRFFPGTLFQDRHRRPQAAGEPELNVKNVNLTSSKLDFVGFVTAKMLGFD